MSRRDIRIRSSRLSASPNARTRTGGDLSLTVQKVSEEPAQEVKQEIQMTEEQLRYIEELEAKLRDERKVIGM